MAKRLLSLGLLLLIGLLRGVNAHNGVGTYDARPTPESRTIIAVYDINNGIEIYDTRQDKVVKSVQAKPEIRNLIIEWINQTDAICAKVNPFSNEGYIVKAPLEPPVVVESEWIHGPIGEVYIVLPKQDSPFYVVLDEFGHISCYNINGDLNLLSQLLDFDFEWSH